MTAYNSIDDSTFEEQTLSCVECKDEFILTVNDQEFFYSKKLSMPKRCRPCRVKRRQQRMEQELNPRQGGLRE